MKVVKKVKSCRGEGGLLLLPLFVEKSEGHDLDSREDMYCITDWANTVRLLLNPRSSWGSSNPS